MSILPILFLQWNASELVGQNHAGSRVGSLHSGVFPHAALPR